MLFLILSPMLGYAQDRPEDAPKALHPTNVFKVQSYTPQKTYFGYSGRSPYTFSKMDNDEVFIADKGGGLDKYVYTSESPLEFNIPIHRYFGPTSTANGLFGLQNPEAVGMAKTVKLFINVYDVDDDYAGKDYFPERDEITLNGFRLTPLILSSGDGAWNVQQFNVPIGYIKFPSKPGEIAQNKISIKIDTLNGGKDILGLEVDWALFEIKALRPLLLLHGYRAIGLIGGVPDSFTVFSDFLYKNGIPHYIVGKPWNGNSSIKDQAKRLGPILEEAKKLLGVERLNIVAHSKAGLDTRLYLRNNYHTALKQIDSIIQIAPPNHGSNAAGLAGLITPASDDLNPENLRDDFNYFKRLIFSGSLFKPNRYEFKPRYLSDYESLGGKLRVAIGDNGKPNAHEDGVMTVSHFSATLPWSVTCWDKYGSLATNCPLLSINLPLFSHKNTWPNRVALDQIFRGTPHGIADFSDQDYAWIVNSIRALSGYPHKVFSMEATKLRSTNRGMIPTAEEKALDYETDEIIYQTLLKTATTNIDEKFLVGSHIKEFYFQFVAKTKEKMEIILHKPDGTAITIPNIEAFEEGIYATKLIEAPTAGWWRIEVNVNDPTQYGLMVSQPVGQYDVLVGVDPSSAQKNESIDIGGYLTKRGTEEVVYDPDITFFADIYYPNGEVKRLPLFDDGLHNDEKANDGLFANKILVGKDEGRINVFTIAQKKNEWQLQSYITEKVDVLGIRSKILGGYKERLVDYNDDDLWDAFTIDVEVDFKEAGSYLLSARLTTNDNVDFEGGANTPVEISSPEKMRVTLSFHGHALAQKNIHGPFVLSKIYLEKIIDGKHVLHDELSDVYETTLKDPNLFNQEPAKLLGISDVREVDNDNDGLYDELEIDYKFTTRFGGIYEIQASLANEAKKIIEWNNLKIDYKPGEQIVTFRFDGKKISRTLANTLYLGNVHFYGRYSMHSGEETPIDINMSQFIPLELPDFTFIGNNNVDSVQVINQGMSTLKPVTVTLSYDSKHENPLISQEFAGMKKGEIATIKFKVNPAKVASTDEVRIYAIVNPQRTIEEFDYSNNYDTFETSTPSITAKQIMNSSLISTGIALNGGKVAVWNFRKAGLQGNGKDSVDKASAPAYVQSLSNIDKVTGGAHHILALSSDGVLHGWGQNLEGEVGCKSAYVATPCVVMQEVVQIEAGENFSVALNREGDVWTWGSNRLGQLGNGNTKNSAIPMKISLNGEKVRLIGSANRGVFAVTEAGHVWAWGNNEASSLGFQGSAYGTRSIESTPKLVTSLNPYAHDIIYIGGGEGWGEALLKEGRVIGWGAKAALGQNTKDTALTTTTPVVIMDNVRQLHARHHGSTALTNGGEIYTWGLSTQSNFFLQGLYGLTPQLRIANPAITYIGGGAAHVYYQMDDGSIYGVGSNGLPYQFGSRPINWSGMKIDLP